MVEAKTDVDQMIREFIVRLKPLIPIEAVFHWDGGLDYASIPLVVISSYFNTPRELKWNDPDDPLLKAAMPDGWDISKEVVTAWGFSPGQLAHDPYSPWLEMMLQDAHQVYPPVEAPAAPRAARKAKAGHVN